MPIACHPPSWLNFCMSEDEEKEIEQIFTEWNFLERVRNILFGSIVTFCHRTSYSKTWYSSKIFSYIGIEN